MNKWKPVRVKGWISDSNVLEPFPIVIQGMEEKFLLKLHQEEGCYIFDKLKRQLPKRNSTLLKIDLKILC